MTDRQPGTRAMDAGAPLIDGRALLQIWLSPAFPVGAFAYSHGLEKAAENGWVGDEASLTRWLADLIASGSLRNDLILLAAAWRAAAAADRAALGEINELAVALQPTRERRLESVQQGGSFLAAVTAAWPAPGVPASEDGEELAYPVAVAMAAAGHGIPLDDVLDAYAIAFAGNLASAAIRLGVVGQTGSQRALAEVLERLRSVSRQAATATLGDLGAVAWRSDIASMQHEVQHTRLFRS